MKPQDLTIGDRVMYHGKPSVITEIRRTVAEVEWDFDSELVDFGDIKPIPLTAEILSRNFESRNFEKTVDFIIKGYRIQKEDGVWWFGYINRVFCKICRVDYVHKLQHALRLVGLYEVADNLRP